MALSPEHVEHYEREGWIAPLDLLSSADAEELRSELEAAEAAYPEHFHAEHRNNAHLVLPFLTELGRHPMIVEAVQALVGADVTLAASISTPSMCPSGASPSW